MNIDLLRQYAFQFVGTPYKFGSKSGIDGIDCSGLVSELLRAAGVLSAHEDLSSQMLFDKFQNNGSWNVLKAGSLVFYGESVNKITHVGMLIDQDSVIEAAGGDSTTTTEEEAIKKQAFVKIRHIKYRSDMVAVLRPRYSWEQL